MTYSPNSLLSVPDRATNAKVWAMEDGTIVLRRLGVCCDDPGRKCLWAVTLSPDLRTIDVEVQYTGAVAPDTPDVLETLQHVLQHQPGVNANLRITSAKAAA